MDFINCATAPYGADLHLTIRNDRIVYARYFDPAPEDEASAEREDYKTKEDTVISREEWQTLQEAIEPLLPLLKEVVPKKPTACLKKARTIFSRQTDRTKAAFI